MRYGSPVPANDFTSGASVALMLLVGIQVGAKVVGITAWTICDLANPLST
jgi:hypothetical protein